jgi:hypothetical protein
MPIGLEEEARARLSLFALAGDFDTDRAVATLSVGRQHEHFRSAAMALK